jgi:hypothetical protein
MYPRAGCVLAILLAGPACGSDTTGPSEQVACTGNVAVSVSSGTTPEISWDPACKAYFVLVEEDGGDAWGVISEDGANAIATPVRYGVVPTGATELNPPSPLSPGTAYAVGVFRWTGPPEDGTLIGTTTFTP